VGIEGPRGARVARRWLLRAEARRAWVILYTHDVAARPSRWGCTPAVLAGLIGHARARGFDIVTVAEGIRRISARN
jgi:peptidoglycan/xylan/chitin deacetylase (PgdA/CDA1 family)